ncbi:MAG: hypothetical protein EA402_12175 [Planctomycetota bacterium]|nr:MAG: hypothetical protein EA402_12175 [Planctomycetota bacterium]
MAHAPLRQPPASGLRPAARLRWQGLLCLLDALALLALPLLPLLSALRRARRGSGIPGLQEKVLGPCASRDLPRGGVVVHGVSLGEVGLMNLVVPALEQSWGGPCVLTTSTATGMQALNQRWRQQPQAWWPLDVPMAVDGFLDRLRPRAVVLLELELWPRFLAACHRRGIPVYVVNGRVSARSYAGYRRLGGVIRPLLRPLALALGQNAEWSARLRALGCQRVCIGGSLKADLVRLASETAVDELRSRLNLDPQRPLLVIASTSDDEEQVCLAAWRQACPDWQLVICPRHPERGARVSEMVAALGASPWRWSLAASPPSAQAVRIVDTIGQLSALYALADMAIVGGSLGSNRHGQNMLEAAAHGCATVVGMDTSNFPDAMALLRTAEAVVETTAEDLAATLARLAADPAWRQRLAAHGRCAWLGARGALARSQRLLAAHAPAPRINDKSLE